MPEFLKLSSDERREVINAAAPKLQLLPAVVEKDVWVCWVLDVLFAIPGRRPMVFKGGTSLSKVFNLIQRFSEDIDISVNFLQDYESPMSQRKADDRRAEIESNLQNFKDAVITPALSAQAKDFGLVAAPGDTEWELHVTYQSVLAAAAPYIKTRIKIEFSGRNETEPSEKCAIRPYLAQVTSELTYPEPTVDALLAQRTFWEKVTLIHAELNADRINATAERMSRHWSDVAVLLKNDAGKQALQDTELCTKVIDHKSKFWRDGKAKYDDCRNKNFRLVPTGNALEVLKRDYQAMIDAGMFFGDYPSTFDEIIRDIAELEKKLNS